MSDRKQIKRKKTELAPYFMILPFLITFLVLFIYPVGFSFFLSFQKYRGFGGMRYVGFNNYISLLNYTGFWKAVDNTLYYFVLHLIPCLGLGFIVAVMLQANCIKRYQRIIKPILFLPQVVSTTATALIYRMIFQTRTGALNQFLNLNIAWLDRPETMKLCVVWLISWRGMGWFIVIFLAGITTIDPALQEAAIIDGASSFQRTVRITMPLMKPTFMFAFVTDAISSLKRFTEINVLVNGQGNASPDVAPIMNIITTNISAGNYGIACAGGWLLFAMILILSLVESQFFRERS